MARAEEHNVHRILNPGVSLESSRKALELAYRSLPVYAAVGIHPNEHVQFGVRDIAGIARNGQRADRGGRR